MTKESKTLHFFLINLWPLEGLRIFTVTVKFLKYVIEGITHKRSGAACSNVSELNPRSK